MPAKPQHNTKQYINCTIMVTNVAHRLSSLHKAVQTAELSFQHHGVNPYHCYSWLSPEPSLAAKQLIQPQNVADMADLLKQMWFLLTIEIYKLWHKGMTSI
jgi:hypothetical protein